MDSSITTEFFLVFLLFQLVCRLPGFVVLVVVVVALLSGSG